MAELEKIHRILKKLDENAPHETILVLDSTTGQNGKNQLVAFKDIVDIDGIILTKLDHPTVSLVNYINFVQLPP